MNKHLATVVASAAGLALLTLAPLPGVADDDAAFGSVQRAHMGQMQGGGQPYPGMMGPGMMGPGMMGPGMMGQGMMGQGMPGQGMMDPSMMGSGMMGQGMMPMMRPTQRGPMGPGMMGQGKMGPGYGTRVVPQQDLSGDDVRHFLEHHLVMQGNPRLKVGEVNEKDDDTVAADIVTTEGALVDRFEVDRHTGQMQRVQ